MTGFEKYDKTTRRAQLLTDMDKIIPWTEPAAAVLSAYPKVSEGGGRPPIPLERMLRIYFLQLWFNCQSDVIHEHAPNAKDFTNKQYRFNGRINEVEKAKSRSKSRVRAKVEHVFVVIKNIFGFRKTRYHGLAKNLHRLEVTAALTNIYMVRRELLKA